MARTAIISIALCTAFVAALPAQAQEFLPLSRIKILDFLGPEKFEPVVLSDKNLPADAKRLQSGGDMVWVFYNKASQTRVAMAGRGDQIYSLRILVAVVNNSEEKNNQVAASLSALFSAIYPDWAQAKDWPVQSLNLSWGATAREMNPNTRTGKSSSGGSDDLIPTQRIDGIVASTFGVPPDLIIYAVTTHEACVPKRSASSATPQDDPMQGLVC